MKKYIIIYYIIVNLICLIPSIISVFLEFDFKFNTLFFFTFSLLNVIAISSVYLNRVVKPSLYFLAITNLIQVFTFVFFGFSYKFLLGPDISFFIFDDGDLSARFAALPYNMIFYVNSFEVDNNFMFGFNFVHFWLFLFFNKLIIEEKKLKTNL
ncbi:MAG: hypothetical protein NWQ14_11245 [Flavobacterium sp.]|uniref:hypothetical protein n=1 Tax=unclassified Flavobacterium TaxID=196869 RepID=UPI0012924372|nr:MULTISPECIES: hypothetical protein [unclassified Flavobacterium]MDP5028790.1 hypothetical protein [Flavobacterium sp.]MQP53260.1 hypothetical protein [Flavobacterium sp. LMO9]MQP63271.1 hypothetical protein [Flavobacterium sp. LMO6]